MVTRKFVFLFVGLLIFCPAVYGQTPEDDELSLIEGRVVLIPDGDQVAIRTKEGKGYTVRIQGIDAPEGDQSFGKKARGKLSDMVLNKDVKVIVLRRDRNDRYVGSVYHNGQDVGLKMLESGMAWHYRSSSSEQAADVRARYARAELKARNDRKGLWSENAPIPPWEFAEEGFEGDGDTSAQATVVESVGQPVGSDTGTPPSAPPSGTAETKPAGNTKDGRTYYLGPRGGCYYLSKSGAKVYVKDKSLCGGQ
ncbi:MAG: thermonuclease family protein [Acidobacteria bacterium]|nr:thermonuclease family protein [Acidobacteriota bacterium]